MSETRRHRADRPAEREEKKTKRKGRKGSSSKSLAAEAGAPADKSFGAMRRQMSSPAIFAATPQAAPPRDGGGLERASSWRSAAGEGAGAPRRRRSSEGNLPPQGLLFQRQRRPSFDAALEKRHEWCVRRRPALDLPPQRARRSGK